MKKLFIKFEMLSLLMCSVLFLIAGNQNILAEADHEPDFFWPAGMVYKYVTPGSGWTGTCWKRACDLDDSEIPSGEFALICHGRNNALYEPSTTEWVVNIAQALIAQGVKDVFAIDWGNFSFDAGYVGLIDSVSSGSHVLTVAKRASYTLFGPNPPITTSEDWGVTAYTDAFTLFDPNATVILDNADPQYFTMGKNGKTLDPRNAHFIGHSHGAHVCGNIASYSQKKYGKTLKWLTLLDASPRYGGHTWNPFDMSPETCAWVSNAKSCAKFVEFYKSSQLMSWDDPIGHVNFLVGKDRNSPRTLDTANFSAEDHSFSHQWYLETIRNPLTNLKFKLGYPLGKSLGQDLINELKSSVSTVTWESEDLENSFIGVIQCNGAANYQLDVLERWETDFMYKQWREDYPDYKINYHGTYHDAGDVVTRHSEMVDYELTTASSDQKYEKGKPIDFQITVEDYLQSSKLSLPQETFININIKDYIKDIITLNVSGISESIWSLLMQDGETEVPIFFYLDTIKDKYKNKDEKSAEGFPKIVWCDKIKVNNISSKDFYLSFPDDVDKIIMDYFDKYPDGHLYLRAEVALSLFDIFLVDVYEPNGQAAIEIKLPQERFAVLCNDNSGSMGWNDPNGQRKNAMEHFLDMLNPDLDRAAIVNFESSVTSSTGFEEPQSLKSQIYIRDGGGTDIAAAINRAISMLQSAVNEIKNNAAIYVLTDGENNDGDAPVISAISRAGSLGIRVHYGHFGGSVFGASELETSTVDIASSDNDVELAYSYNSIAEAVIATGGIYGEIRTADDIESFVDLIFRSGLTMDDPSDKRTIPGQVRIYDIMYEGQNEIEYWFSGREKEEIGITVTGVDYYPEITLFDKDANQLEEDLNEDGDRIAEITTTLPYTGMYKVKIKAKNGGYGLYNILVDVANDIVENVTDHVTTSFSSWKVDPNTGALVGDLVLHNNEDSPKLLQKSFWYALPEGDSLKLVNTDGTNSDGIPYMDITQLVEAQLPNIGNRDLVLDPGETVVISGITVYSKDRSIPQGQLYAIWADPPKIKTTLPTLSAILSKDGSTVSIYWSTSEVQPAASTYILEESDSLTHPNWNSVSTETVLQNQKEVLVVPTNNGTKFYRLRQK